jgi:hypothetical protein
LPARNTALERPLGGAVDVGLEGLRDDRIAHEQALADQTIDEHVGVPGGISHRKPSNQTELGIVAARMTSRSTRRASGMAGVNVPRLNTIPRNSASAGMGVTVALVSGPRTVTCVTSRWVVTTICQRLAATEMNAGSGSLRLIHIFSTKPES